MHKKSSQPGKCLCEFRSLSLLPFLIGCLRAPFSLTPFTALVKNIEMFPFLTRDKRKTATSRHVLSISASDIPASGLGCTLVPMQAQSGSP